MIQKTKRWGNKKHYPRDWKKVNETYVQTGVYYLDLDWVENWHNELKEMNKGKKGAPYQFPKSLIELQAAWNMFHSYRAVEGITRQVVKFSKLPCCNDYSTIYRRITAIELNIPLPKTKEFSVATDGTGMKMNMGGEYFEEKYGKKNKRKKFIKVTVTSDPFEKDVVKVHVALEGEGDSESEVAEKHMKELIEEEGCEIKSFFGDGSFDKHALFDFCDWKRIEPAIKIRKNAVIDECGSWKRNVEVEKYQKLGYKEWAKQKNYGMRWTGTEGIFSAVKRIFGERVRARKVSEMCGEAFRKFWVYQRIRSYTRRKVKEFE